MKKKLIIIGLVILFVFSWLGFANANIEIENKTIDFDLIPDKITEDTYLPIEKLVNQGLFNIEKVSSDRYIVLKNDNYYILVNNRNLVRSNLRNRNLNNTPIMINKHFLVPVEFLDKFLGLRVRLEGELTLPDRIDRDDQNNSKNNLRLRVYLNDDEFNRYEDLEVRIEIMNPNRNEINLRFDSAQKYNIYIKNRYGRILYSWADGKIFSQARQNIKIEGRDSLSFEEEIDLKQFREGKYFVEVEIVADNYDFEKIENSFEIDD